MTTMEPIRLGKVDLHVESASSDVLCWKRPANQKDE